MPRMQPHPLRYRPSSDSHPLPPPAPCLPACRPGEHPDHVVVIKYVPYVADSKRAMDEYTSEIFLGGRNTIVMHNTCEVGAGVCVCGVGQRGWVVAGVGRRRGRGGRGWVAAGGLGRTGLAAGGWGVVSQAVLLGGLQCMRCMPAATTLFLPPPPTPLPPLSPHLCPPRCLPAPPATWCRTPCWLPPS